MPCEDRDGVVLLHHVGAELGAGLAVDPHLDAAAVAADALRVEPQAPDVEDLLEVRREVLLVGLHVDHAGVVVGVNRRQQLRRLVDADQGRHRRLVAVRVDRDVGVVVRRVARRRVCRRQAHGRQRSLQVRVVGRPGALADPVHLGSRVPLRDHRRGLVAVGAGRAAARHQQRSHDRDGRDQDGAADDPRPGRHAARAAPTDRPAAVAGDAVAAAEAAGAVLVCALFLALAHRGGTIDFESDASAQRGTPGGAVLPLLRTAAGQLLRRPDRGRRGLVRPLSGMFQGRTRCR